MTTLADSILQRESENGTFCPCYSVRVQFEMKIDSDLDTLEAELDQ